MDPSDARYASLTRLYGLAAVQAFSRAHVCVVGVGGVGSWAVEALARSGVGTLTLIDLDDICVTNTNRQIHALVPTVGQPKIDVLAERVLAINPDLTVHRVPQFVTESNAADCLPATADITIDATDRMSVKAAILGVTKARGKAAITAGSAGGKRDPSRIRVVDLGAAGRDELLRLVRRKLRRDYGWARGEGHQYGVPAVISDEAPWFPWPDGSVRAETPDEACNLHMDCTTGFGAAVHITGIFGFLAASEALRILTERTE